MRLVRAILGHKEQPLRLSKGFRGKVAEALDIDAIDENAWWATDYHYDWLAGALAVHVEGDGAVQKPRLNRSSQGSSDPPKQRHLVEGNQEDTDLIIASGSDLILVEAKAFGAWGNAQMTSKLARLELLQKELSAITGKVRPDSEIRLHLLLISPREPKKLKAWPDWLKREGRIPWIKLDLSSGDQPILDVSRCDENGKKKVSTDYWRIGEIKPLLPSPSPASAVSAESKTPSA